MRKSFGILLAACAFVAPAASGENLAALFPLRASITAENVGLTRLDLPPEILGACRSDLADLRVVAADGREIPYLIDSPPATGRHLEVEYRADAKVLGAGRSQQVTGEITEYTEDFILGLPLMPVEISAWELVLSVQQEEFVAKIDITATTRDNRRETIVENGSVFRLPSVGAERTRFVIPARNARRLQISLKGQDQGFLSPSFGLEGSRLLAATGSGVIDLETLATRDHPGHTEVVLRRPRGFVPRRIRLTTSTGIFHRKVTVWDEGPGASTEPLGSRAVLRIDAIAPIEVQEIPLKPARGGRLRIVIENQDSPPLEDLAFSALMPRPTVVFSLPAGEPRATLVFGGGRAHRPRYDILALDPRSSLPAAGEEAQQALALLDPSRAQQADLGSIEANPEYDAAPALAFAMHPGTEIDRRMFSHRRRLEITPSAEGLARLQLQPGDLSLLRPDLADLRVADANGRQWAYLRQQATQTTPIPLTLAGHEVRERRSTYRLDIPEAPITTTRLHLETGAPYFDRDYRLIGRLEGGKTRVMSAGRLIRRIGDPRPVTIAFPSERLVGFDLEIEDGDDAPLDLNSFTARVEVPDIFLAAQAGSYELLLGFPKADVPRYELERVRSTVLAVPAARIEAGPLEENPDFSRARRLSGSAGSQRLVLWVVLGLAVLVLGALTLRAARQEEGTG